MGRLEGAIQDYRRILELEPSNKPARTELEKLEARLESKEAEVKEVKEVKEKVEKLNLKNNMKAMFKPKKGNVERLEPESDFAPSFLLDSGDGSKRSSRGGEERTHSVKRRDLPPWGPTDPELLVHPVQKPPHLR